jgi:hypothetical protein
LEVTGTAPPDGGSINVAAIVERALIVVDTRCARMVLPDAYDPANDRDLEEKYRQDIEEST